MVFLDFPMTTILAEQMAALPEPPDDSAPPYWDYWRHDLWQRAQAEPIENFMGWPCIYHTMLVNHFEIDHQLDYLRERGKWDYLPACQLPLVGKPLDEYENTGFSRNMINQVYHLARWEIETGRSLSSLEHILEFGGGFGAMALAAHRLGFRGEYLIYDYPEFSLLQKWFLAEHNVPVGHEPNPQPRRYTDLFIAIYSLSETPEAFRNAFLSELWADSYLFLYSSRFAEVDNLRWFADLRDQKPNYLWITQAFPGRPDYYSFGYEVKPVR